VGFAPYSLWPARLILLPDVPYNARVQTLPEVTRYFHPVLESRRLNNESFCVQIAGHKYAVWRNAAGKPAVVADAVRIAWLPFRKGKVRRSVRLACAYHGWNFDADGHGQSPSQPGLKLCDTVAYHVVERFGYIWIADQDVALSQFPSISSAPLGPVVRNTKRFYATLLPLVRQKPP
jgi:phenylpropionate dioxygenase-like ring-hydroxylating dioxygenase large terminal subunit